MASDVRSARPSGLYRLTFPFQGSPSSRSDKALITLIRLHPPIHNCSSPDEELSGVGGPPASNCCVVALLSLVRVHVRAVRGIAMASEGSSAVEAKLQAWKDGCDGVGPQLPDPACRSDDSGVGPFLLPSQCRRLSKNEYVINWFIYERVKKTYSSGEVLLTCHCTFSHSNADTAYKRNELMAMLSVSYGILCGLLFALLRVGVTGDEWNISVKTLVKMALCVTQSLGECSLCVVHGSRACLLLTC